MLQESSNKVNTYYQKSNALGKQLASIETTLDIPEFPELGIDQNGDDESSFMVHMEHMVEQAKHLLYLYSLHYKILRKLNKHFTTLKDVMIKVYNQHQPIHQGDGITPDTQETIGDEWESHISYMTHTIHTRVSHVRRKKTLVQSLLSYSKRVMDIHTTIDSVRSISNDVITTQVHNILELLKELDSTFEIILNVYETKRYFRTNHEQVTDLTETVTRWKQTLKNICSPQKTKPSISDSDSYLIRLDTIRAYVGEILTSGIVNDSQYVSSFRNTISTCNGIQRVIEASQSRIRERGLGGDTKLVEEQTRLLQQAIHNSINKLKTPYLS